MPAPRELSLVVCSCGMRLGDLRRAESPNEDVEAVELTALRGKVATLVQHWRWRHELTIHPRAPLAVKALIAKAARELADDAVPAAETGMVRR